MTDDHRLDLIRKLVEALCWADQELALPGSVRTHGRDIRARIADVLDEAFKELDLEEGKGQDDAQAIAKLVRKHKRPSDSLS